MDKITPIKQIKLTHMVITLKNKYIYPKVWLIFTFGHLADALRLFKWLAKEDNKAIKTNKRAMIRKCYNNTQLA